jgi:hypothetical protein
LSNWAAMCRIILSSEQNIKYSNLIPFRIYRRLALDY